ncbi:MAG: copper chaperone PCu(A)C [Pseudomonadota bacterium]
MTRTLLAALAFTLATATAATAHDYKLGDLMIDEPVARATAPGAKVGAGYVTIMNKGDKDAFLVGGEADFAGLIEIHEGKVENGVMTMKAFENGLIIPAGGTAVMKPGGNHVMFMKLKQPLTEGETLPVTLRFKEAGEVKIDFKVLSIADTMKMKGGMAMDHSKMDHSKMDHSKMDHSGHGNHGGHSEKKADE